MRMARACAGMCGTRLARCRSPAVASRQVTLTGFSVEGNLRGEPIVVASALKHGVSESDALHVVHNAIVRWNLDEGVEVFVGADQSGRMLEVGLVERDDVRLLIHAMPVRAKHLPRRK